MKEKSIFSQIIDREIPANIIFEDDTCIIIEDISPQAPIHYLAIPKKEIKSISDLSETDHGIIDHLMIAIKNEMSKIDFVYSSRISFRDLKIPIQRPRFGQNLNS